MGDHGRDDATHLGGLLERESALARLTDLAASAFDGRGSLAAVVGGVGEGKTAVLGEAGAIGRQAGLRVWRAFGSSLECPFAFGVVRQLLQPAVMAIDLVARALVFTGAARLAASVLDVEGHPQPLDAGAAQHGLYWLLVELASRGPLMLLVDDAHWADAPSLAWLAFLIRRIGELGALVVVAARPQAFDGAGDGLAALLSDPQIPLLRVGPLGTPSVEALVRRELQAEPDRGFIEACRRATGGNPLAVIELLRELGRDGAEPDEAWAKRLADRAPETIERHVRGRLDRLGPDAVGLAQALAVLGDRSQLRQLGGLANLELERAAELVDELTLAGIVARAVELRFEHPLVHAAVRDAMTARRRATLHARAAALLAREDADPEAIAAHLLIAEPAGEARNVAGLRSAADAALRRGSPDAAVAYLERALQEPPSADLRSGVLGELGQAVWAAGGSPRSIICRRHASSPSTRERGRTWI
jgi:hypothetical protein